MKVNKSDIKKLESAWAVLDRIFHGDNGDELYDVMIDSYGAQPDTCALSLGEIIQALKSESGIRNK